MIQDKLNNGYFTALSFGIDIFFDDNDRLTAAKAVIVNAPCFNSGPRDVIETEICESRVALVSKDAEVYPVCLVCSYMRDKFNLAPITKQLIEVLEKNRENEKLKRRGMYKPRLEEEEE